MIELEDQRIIEHGKHKGKMLWEVIRDDPNYALYASREYAWFPKLDQFQKSSCLHRYKRKPVNDWSTWGMQDYGDGWV